MLFIPCTSNCRTHLSKTKKNQNSLVYCIKIALAHPGYEKEKLCQTKSFILLLHILMLYHRPTIQDCNKDEMTKTLCPLLHHHSQKLVKSH